MDRIWTDSHWAMQLADDADTAELGMPSKRRRVDEEALTEEFRGQAELLIDLVRSISSSVSQLFSNQAPPEVDHRLSALEDKLEHASSLSQHHVAVLGLPAQTAL